MTFAIAFVCVSTLAVCNPFVSAQTESTADRLDIDQSGSVDFVDFLEFARLFGSQDETFDLDSSGEVDFADFLVFAQSFNEITRFSPVRTGPSSPMRSTRSATSRRCLD